MLTPSAMNFSSLVREVATFHFFSKQISTSLCSLFQCSMTTYARRLCLRTKYSEKTISILECGVGRPTSRVWKADILSRFVAELDSTASKRLLSAFVWHDCSGTVFWQLDVYSTSCGTYRGL